MIFHKSFKREVRECGLASGSLGHIANGLYLESKFWNTFIYVAHLEIPKRHLQLSFSNKTFSFTLAYR